MSGDQGSKQGGGRVQRTAGTRSRARKKAKSTPEELSPERRLELVLRSIQLISALQNCRID